MNKFKKPSAHSKDIFSEESYSVYTNEESTLRPAYFDSVESYMNEFKKPCVHSKDVFSKESSIVYYTNEESFLKPAYFDSVEELESC